MKKLREQIDDLKKWVTQIWGTLKERNEKIDTLLDGLAKNTAEASKTMEGLQKLIDELTVFANHLAMDYDDLMERVKVLESKDTFIKGFLDWIFRRAKAK